MATLKTHNLTLEYDGKRVIENLEFCANSGEFLAVVGENGTGKSTLVKALAGLKKQAAGEIIIDKAFGKIGYISQGNDTQKNFPASVLEVVASGLEPNRKLFRPIKNEDDKIDEVLKLLDIKDLKSLPYSSLSGGQQRRVLLARALLTGEKLLILDEPTAALDKQHTDSFFEIIKGLTKDKSTLAIVVLHDDDIAFKYATKILLIGKKGQELLSPEEYKGRLDLC